MGTIRVCSNCRKPKKTWGAVAGGPLTFREGQIVELLAQAKSNKEIADILRLTEGTVKEYCNRIFRKTGKHGRMALVLAALRRDLQEVCGKHNLGTPEHSAAWERVRDFAATGVYAVKL